MNASQASGKLTEVAAAILMRGDAARLARGECDEFLLARRPEGKVYAGWWEFPGGKVEAGETYHEALVRELREEMGIEITGAHPWLMREFVYPHATVRIRFFRVTAWNGSLQAHEHDGMVWVKSADSLAGKVSVTPVLPANGPIIKGLTLPTVCAITHAEVNGIPAELARLDAALAQGLRFFILRDKGLAAAPREDFARQVLARCRDHGALMLVNGDAELASRIGADGLHLPAGMLLHTQQRPDFHWVGGSCHTADELAHAASLGLDYALLGSVLPTPTHPETEGMGWERFAALLDHSTLPVFALGGMQIHPTVITQAQACGAHGVALMRGWGIPSL